MVRQPTGAPSAQIHKTAHCGDQPNIPPCSGHTSIQFSCRDHPCSDHTNTRYPCSDHPCSSHTTIQPPYAGSTTTVQIWTRYLYCYLVNQRSHWLAIHWVTYRLAWLGNLPHRAGSLIDYVTTPVCVCLHACVRVYVHVCMHVLIHLHVCVYVCICVYMCVCVRVCVCVSAETAIVIIWQGTGHKLFHKQRVLRTQNHVT